MRTFAHFCGLLAAITLLSACGTKGPLVRPAPTAATTSASAAATPQSDHSSAPEAAR